MGEIAIVESYDAGRVKCDPGGGDLATAEHYGPCGDDSPPLSGDSAALEDSAGTGSKQVSGYDDGLAKAALPGEVRRYSRDADGGIVCVVYLKRDGTLHLQAPGGTASQSFVRGDEQADALKTFADAINSYAVAIQAIADPGNAATPTLTAAITAFKAAVDAALSTVIKGE